MLHLIKNHLPVDYLQDGFVVYNDKLLFHKREYVTVITDSMVPVNFCKKIINFTTDNMTSNF